MSRSNTRPARSGAPVGGADMPVCARCWSPTAVLKRGEIHVESRADGELIAHQRRRCRAIRPTSTVAVDRFVAYVAPRPAVRLVDVNRSKTVA